MNSTDENEIMYLFDMSAQIVLDLVVCFFIIFLIFVIAFIICKLNNFYKFKDKKLKIYIVLLGIIHIQLK